MFPSGSTELVGPVYENPILSAPFNEQLAAAVRSYCNDMLQVLFRCTEVVHRMSCLVLISCLSKETGRCSQHVERSCLE